MSWEDVKKELESDEYKTEYARSVDILNSLIRPLMFIKVNCNIHKSFTGTLFFKFIIDDLIHSLIGLKVLLDEGIVNSLIILLFLNICEPISSKVSGNTITSDNLV